MPDRDATHALPLSKPRRVGAREGMLIPGTLLLAVCGFGESLPAERVAEAIAKGVRAGEMPEPDLCPIGEGVRGTAVAGTLDKRDFDARMRRARAVIVGAGRLDREMLAGSAVFEIATRARQAGVPAYAVTGMNALDAFGARMLDLQIVLEARSVRALSATGRKLALLA